jgi:hypothetical protein
MRLSKKFKPIQPQISYISKESKQKWKQMY